MKQLVRCVEQLGPNMSLYRYTVVGLKPYRQTTFTAQPSGARRHPYVIVFVVR